MRALHQRVFIIGAENAHRNATENAVRTSQLGAALAERDITFKRLGGQYNGTAEDSFLVVDAPGRRELVQHFAIQFGQESFLELHPDRAAELHYCEYGTPSDILGTFQRGTPKPGEDFSEDLYDGSTWVIR